MAEQSPNGAISHDAIDPAAPGARERIAALYPRVVVDEVLPAPREASADAIEYLAAASEVERAEGRKKRAGNALLLSIADARGIEGVGFRAVTAEKAGYVDLERLRRKLKKTPAMWEALLAECRKPGHRELRVTRKE